MTSVLKIRDLTLGFRKGRQTAQVLHGISMHVNAGEKVALVGESGSGKSVTAQLALGRLQQERGTLTSGEIDGGIWTSGMVQGLIDSYPSCAEIIDDIISECVGTINQRLAGFIND